MLLTTCTKHRQKRGGLYAFFESRSLPFGPADARSAGIEMMQPYTIGWGTLAQTESSGHARLWHIAMSRLTVLVRVCIRLDGERGVSSSKGTLPRAAPTSAAGSGSSSTAAALLGDTCAEQRESTSPALTDWSNCSHGGDLHAVTFGCCSAGDITATS